MAVELEGHHRGARLGQGEGERPRTRAHLHHVVTGAHAGEPSDAPHRVRVDDEVLPQRAARRHPVLGEERLQLPAGVGHPRRATR